MENGSFSVGFVFPLVKLTKVSFQTLTKIYEKTIAFCNDQPHNNTVLKVR